MTLKLWESYKRGAGQEARGQSVFWRMEEAEVSGEGGRAPRAGRLGMSRDLQAGLSLRSCGKERRPAQ